MIYCRRVMKMNKETQHIQRLHKFLPVLRKVAGWTSADLAKKLDVSKATMVNIEKPSAQLTMIQYLAIRALFREEAEEHGNIALGQMVDKLVDNSALTDDQREEYCQVVGDNTREKGRFIGTADIGRAAAARFLERYGSKPVSEVTKKLSLDSEAAQAVIDRIKDKPVCTLLKGGEKN